MKNSPTFLLQFDGLYSLNLPIKILCCDTTDSAILDLAVSYHLPRFLAAHEIVHLSVVASTAAKKYIFCRKVFRNTRNSVKIETLQHLTLYNTSKQSNQDSNRATPKIPIRLTSQKSHTLTTLI